MAKSSLLSDAIGAGALGSLQAERPPAVTLPHQPYASHQDLRVWMEVEHYLANHPTATLGQALRATATSRSDYERAKKIMVGGDMSFGDADLIRPGKGPLKHLAAKGSDGKGA